MLIDRIDRIIIKHYYRKYPNGSWWNEPPQVASYVRMKACRDLKRVINKELSKINLKLK